MKTPHIFKETEKKVKKLQMTLEISWKRVF